MNGATVRDLKLSTPDRVASWSEATSPQTRNPTELVSVARGFLRYRTSLESNWLVVQKPVNRRRKVGGVACLKPRPRYLRTGESRMSTVSFTNTRASLVVAKRADADWGSLCTVQRIRWIELHGYVVIPELLSAAQLGAIRAAMMRLPTTGVDYSKDQRGCTNVQCTDSRMRKQK